MEEEKMHWIYFLCGGFIIGILATLVSGSLWSISDYILKKFGVFWYPGRFIKKCWGYW